MDDYEKQVKVVNEIKGSIWVSVFHFGKISGIFLKKVWKNVKCGNIWKLKKLLMLGKVRKKMKIIANNVSFWENRENLKNSTKVKINQIILKNSFIMENIEKTNRFEKKTEILENLLNLETW